MFKRLKRRTITLAAAVLLASSAAVAAPATSASAAPWNCPVKGEGLSRSTQCLAGAGWFRVAIHCITYGGAWSRMVYGPWINMNEGIPSVGWCAAWEYVGAAYAQTGD